MKLKELENLIQKAASIYYSGEYGGVKYDSPIMTDAQFDQYVSWLRSINPHSPILSKTGWGFNPNSVSGDKVRHLHGGMESIANKPRDVKDIPESLRTNVRISAKLDGLSGKIEIVDGKFTRCSTRGDGMVGIDRTDKFKAILERYGGIDLPEEFTGEIRGEFVISQTNWQHMIDSGIAKKNSRNTASGIINCDGVPYEIKYLDFIPYKVIYDKNNVFPNTLLDSMGDCKFCEYFTNFPHLPMVLVSSNYYDQSYLEELYESFNILWPCDGIVITSNNVVKDYNGEVRYNEVAYKFETLKKVTTIKDIVWQMSKQNILCPVAELDPVDIDGATISRVTLNNAQFVIDNNIYAGCEVEIMRSGGVIPKLTSVISIPEISKNSIPDHCPVCGSSLIMDGPFLKCTNSNCSNKAYQDLKCWFNFIGRIDGMAETTAFTYFDRFRINSIEDIYKFDITVNKGLTAEGTTSGKFYSVMNKMINGKHSLVNALQAVNIPRIGEISAKKISQDKNCIAALSSLIKSIMSGNIVDGIQKDTLIESIRNICGDATADSLKLNCDKLYKYWSFIASNIEIPEIINNSTVDISPVCITGKLSMPRKEFEKILADFGYVVKDDVTKKTKYLITNDINGTSGKHKQANKLGTEKISEQEMLTMLGR